jgi:hypothetical protein
MHREREQAQTNELSSQWMAGRQETIEKLAKALLDMTMRLVELGEEVDLFRLAIRDLSTGGVIRQHRETDGCGQYVKKPTGRRARGQRFGRGCSEQNFALTGSPSLLRTSHHYHWATTKVVRKTSLSQSRLKATTPRASRWKRLATCRCIWQKYQLGIHAAKGGSGRDPAMGGFDFNDSMGMANALPRCYAEALGKASCPPPAKAK